MQLRSFVFHSQHPWFLLGATRCSSAIARLSTLAILGVTLAGHPVFALSLSHTGETSAPDPISSHSGTSDVLVAEGFSPPDGRGMPGRREGGGTRGGLIIEGTPPTALVPASNVGTTLAEHPTLYFYVPTETAGLNTEVILLDNDGNTVYQTSTLLPSEEGIVSLSLPPDVTLEPEHLYQWIFSVVVSEDDPSANIILSGWIRRIAETPELAQQLAAIAPSEHPTIYADAGLWYEALNSLAELRRNDPDNAAVELQWSALLESVELGAITSKPLLSNLPAVGSPTE
jgi:hypothetical protein